MSNDRREKRLPPGQQLAAKGMWPVVGERRPASGTKDWTIEVVGEVDSPRSWSIGELKQYPAYEAAVDIHCVTRWSLLDVRVRGVLLKDLLAGVAPRDEARFISFVADSPRRHSTSLHLDDALSLGAIVAWEVNDKPIPSEHGGPVRMIVPGRYFYKSVKWLRTIELLVADRLGYWEADAGYHNHADPWQEERFATSSLSRLEVRDLMKSRDWSGRDLLSLTAADRNLQGLVARRAALRAADFSRTVLADADFSQANLSNSRFIDSNLRNAVFRDADIEGCDFSGADLRGADLRVASGLGVSFVSEGHRAQFDNETRIAPSLLSALSEKQRAFVESSRKPQGGT